MSDKLRQAITLIRSGDKQGGGRLLSEVLRNDPRNETAWLWMSGIVTTDRQRRDCLERVLAINPENAFARKGMALLRAQETPRAASAKTPAPPAEGISTASSMPVGHVPAPTEGDGVSDDAQAGVNTMDAGDALAQVSPNAYPASEQPAAAVPDVPTGAEEISESPLQSKPKSRLARRIALIVTAAGVLCALLGAVAYVVLSFLPNGSLPSDQHADSIALLTPGAPTATPPGEEIADPDYIQGKAAYVAEDYEQVLRLMDRVVERHPDLAPPYWYRGMAYFYTGRYEPMLDEMEKALSLDPEYALGYADRGLAYVMLGDEPRAMADWQKALSLDPTLAKVYHRYAVVYANKGDYARAIPEYDRALAIDPTRAQTWSERGQALLNVGRYEDCIDSATRALDLEPDLWSSYYNRGTCKVELGQYSAGILDLDQYVVARPDNAQGWYNRALARRLGNLGDNQQALDDYSRAIQLDPTFTWALINRGNVYIDLQEYQLAMDDYDAALALGEIPRAYMGRGDAYWGLGEYDQAVAAYKQAIRMIPGYAAAYARLARTYVDQGEYEQALEAADRALALDPGSDELAIRQTRSRAYYGLGEYQQAIEESTRIIEAGPSVMDYYYRGLAYQAAGQEERAVEDLELFLALGGAGRQDRIDDATARLSQLR